MKKIMKIIINILYYPFSIYNTGRTGAAYEERLCLKSLLKFCERISMQTDLRNV